MNPNKMLWEKGDFTQLAETMRNSGTTLVAQLGITKGINVLDLGCGDGTTALPEARLGAIVLGVDIASNLVAAGNSRARAEGLADWLRRAVATPVPEMRGFARGIGQDEAAVRAGLSLPWSNGAVEEQINRLMVIKRTMYGRAGIPLLRARLRRAG